MYARGSSRVLGAAVLGLALFSHGSQAAPPQPYLQATAPDQHRVQAQEPKEIFTVDIISDSFLPPAVTIPLGATVRWMNLDEQMSHTTTAAKGEWDSGPLELARTYDVTFQKPGTFKYYCRIRGPQVSGIVIVEKPSQP